MDAIEFIASIDVLLAGWMVPLGFQQLGRRRSLACFLIGTIPLMGTEIWWGMITDATAVQRIIAAGLTGAFCGAVLLIGVSEVLGGTARAQSSTSLPVTQSSGPIVTGSGTTVVSIGQTGGVTAGTYVNQAVTPELRIVSQEGNTNPDGSYTSNMAVQVVAPVTPANLHISLQADDILSTNITPPPQNGISMMITRNVIRSGNSFSADIPSPYGTYTISVKTRSQTPINLDSHF